MQLQNPPSNGIEACVTVSSSDKSLPFTRAACSKQPRSRRYQAAGSVDVPPTGSILLSAARMQSAV